VRIPPKSPPPCWRRIRQDIQRDYQVDAAPHELLLKLQRCQRALPKPIESYFEGLPRAVA
jgi:hypothetical protein